jgi:hypothetical protein
MKTKKAKKSKKSKQSTKNSIDLNKLFNNDVSSKQSNQTNTTINNTKIQKYKNTKTKKYVLKNINNVLNIIYGLDNTININLITYNDKETKLLNKQALYHFKLCKPYSYDILNEYFDKISLSYKVKENLLEDIHMDSAPPLVKSAMEDFTRGMSAYINSIYHHLPIKISNAFCKLWEVLEVFDTIIPNIPNIKYQKSPQKFKVFHICEAPGNMIVSAKYFAEMKRKNIKPENYDWRANSLNPNNLENQALYGKGKIFGDTYGLIKKNYNKWLWGADNTGDITKVSNIKWFRNYINNSWLKKDEDQSDKLDFICGDAGLSTDTNEPIILQKLDLAQVITVLACSSIGGSCCIKHFTPYIKRYTDTYEASGFFIGFLYLYFITFENVNLFKPYTSNPDSGEFYVVGRGFKGISENQLENLYSILDNFTFNSAIIKQEDIPETFIIQVNTFLQKISNLNSMSIEKQNLLLTCYKEKEKVKIKSKLKSKSSQKSKAQLEKEYTKVDKLLHCEKFLNENNLKDILIPRYKEWIKIYKFM